MHSASISPPRMARTSAAHSISSSRVVAKRSSVRFRADPVAGTSDALQRGRDRARRAELHDQVDRADVDAELERRGRDDGAKLAVLQAMLGVEARLRVTRLPWCGITTPSPRRSVSANATRSLIRRVGDEDQRRAIGANRARQMRS